MKNLLSATAAIALTAGPALAGGHGDAVKIGILLGFTGGAETLAPDMAGAAEAAIAEASDSGMFMDGMTIEAVRRDSGCAGDLAPPAAEQLVSEGVSGIVGALCSGATTAALQNVALANGIVMISPSSTSPALTEIEDDGLFFRTAPSDARQGAVIAEMLNEMGMGSIALTYTNNDYGKGLADSIERNFTEAGGSVTESLPHEDNKGDYSAEVGTLDSAGGDILVVAGYADKGGQGIVRSSLDLGSYDTFLLPDAMISPIMEEVFGSEIDGSVGVVPGSDSPGTGMFMDMEANFTPGTPYAAESYDAAALIILAMQAAGSIAPADYKMEVMNVANAPGEKIYPGELGKALEILAGGGEIDYEGATAVTLVDPGEAAGSYRQIEVTGGKIETVGYR